MNGGDEMQLLNIKEVASILNVSVSTVNRLISKGDLAIVKVGNSTRIKKETLEKYINGGD